MKLWYQEPVVVVAMLVALVPAVLGALSAFGVAITPGQVAAVASLLTAIGAVVARSQVVPMGPSGGTPTAPGDPKPPAVKEDSTMRLALRRFVLALTFVFLTGCTATQGVAVAQIIADFCPAGVTLLGEPGWAPLCAGIPEVEAIFAGWLGEMNAAAAKGTKLPAPHTGTDLYHAVLARRAAAAAAKGGAK